MVGHAVIRTLPSGAEATLTPTRAVQARALAASLAPFAAKQRSDPSATASVLAAALPRTFKPGIVVGEEQKNEEKKVSDDFYVT